MRVDCEGWITMDNPVVGYSIWQDNYGAPSPIPSTLLLVHPPANAQNILRSAVLRICPMMGFSELFN